MKRSTQTRQYLGATVDLLKKCRSATSACISCMGPSIVCSISRLWVTDFSCIKGIVRTTFLLGNSFALPPFLTKLLYKLYKALFFAYLLFEIFLTNFLLGVSTFAKTTLFSSTLNFVSKFVIFFLGPTCFFIILHCRWSPPFLHWVRTFYLYLFCSSLHSPSSACYSQYRDGNTDIKLFKYSFKVGMQW